MLQLVKSTRTAMDQGNNISTIEKAYSKMTDNNWVFLHFNASWPHPNDPGKQMQMMIFGSPTLIGLLKGPSIDIFVDATFGCCPHPFEQCLIIMVHDHHTSAYVPVLYILMTNKFESQYKQAFFQVWMLSEGKINVCTYTSDFLERGLMNGLDKMFGSKYGHSGTHIGCFFHLKQAW